MRQNKAKAEIVCAVDVGSSGVKVALGRGDAQGGGDLVAALALPLPKNAVERGRVRDVGAAARVVADALDKASRDDEGKTRYVINTVLAVISGNVCDATPWASTSEQGWGKVGPRRLRELKLKAISTWAEGREPAVAAPTLVSVLSQGFSEDGAARRDLRPEGWAAERLRLDALRVFADGGALENLSRCLYLGGASLGAVSLGTAASSEATLSAEDKELGCACIDVGADTTDVALYCDGALAACKSFPFGGDDLDRRLAAEYYMSDRAASAMKVEHLSTRAVARPDWGRRLQYIRADGSFGECEVADAVALVDDLCRSALAEVKAFAERAAGDARALSRGLVLTGGGSQLKGLAQTAQNVFGLPARAGASPRWDRDEQDPPGAVRPPAAPGAAPLGARIVSKAALGRLPPAFAAVVGAARLRLSPDGLVIYSGA